MGEPISGSGSAVENNHDSIGPPKTSMPEIFNVIAVANAVCEEDWHKVGTTIILKKKTRLAAVRNEAGFFSIHGAEGRNRTIDTRIFSPLALPAELPRLDKKTY